MDDGHDQTFVAVEDQHPSSQNTPESFDALGLSRSRGTGRAASEAKLHGLSQGEVAPFRQRRPHQSDASSLVLEAVIEFRPAAAYHGSGALGGKIHFVKHTVYNEDRQNWTHVFVASHLTIPVPSQLLFVGDHAQQVSHHVEVVNRFEQQVFDLQRSHLVPPFLVRFSQPLSLVLQRFEQSLQTDRGGAVLGLHGHLALLRETYPLAQEEHLARVLARVGIFLE